MIRSHVVLPNNGKSRPENPISFTEGILKALFVKILPLTQLVPRLRDVRPNGREPAAGVFGGT
jgi:hypothetical protein